MKRPEAKGIEGAPNAKARGVFDVSLEEVLHQVTDVGWGGAYPEVFGRVPGTEMANAVNLARGGRYMEDPPEQYPDTLKTPGIPITTRRAITTVSFRNIFTGGLRRYWADRVCITDCLQYALRYYLVSQYPVKSY